MNRGCGLKEDGECENATVNGSCKAPKKHLRVGSQYKFLHAEGHIEFRKWRFSIKISIDFWRTQTPQVKKKLL